MKKKEYEHKFLRKMKKQNTAIKRSRLFGGNILAPGEFLFVYGMIFVFLFIVWFICFNNMRTYTYEDCKIKVLYYVESHFDEKNNFIIVADEEKQKNNEIVLDRDDYIVISDAFNINGFQQKIQKGQYVKICYVKNDNAKHALEIAVDNEKFLTLKDINDAAINSRKTVNTVFSVITGIWVLYVGTSCYVMTNAHKYPRLVKLFVKKSHILPPLNDSKSSIHFVKKNRKD